ncbi:MAG TPA: DUF1731 domain-containing protein [Armatimonadota bacterium]
MKTLIAGSNGMIGSAVTRHLIECGYEVVRLVRRTPGPGEVRWNPDSGEIDKAGLDGFDGVVHLATMPWPMRWTARAKQNMRANRLATNRLLAESLAGCAHKPQVLICASGMGFYPSSGDTVLTEVFPAGTSFLAGLQQDGEAAATPASLAGIRVVHLRIPPVIGGPALQRAGFQAGNGQQWVSWVGQDELASMIEFALTAVTLAGPVNAVSPNPLRNTEFSAATIRALGHKPGRSMPAFMVRLMMGEMGEEFLLSSRRMQPAKLLAAGYRFRFPELAQALQHELESMNAGLVARPVTKLQT